MDITQVKDILWKLFGFIVEDANKVIKYLELPRDARVLDIGTGMGYFAIILALNGHVGTSLAILS